MYSMACAHCGKPFEARNRTARYCALSCRKAVEQEKFRALNAPSLGISTNATGAAHEMLVCIDLLRRGFYVYRSVSASAPYDLVVGNGNSMKSVEVTTGSYSISGPVYFTGKDTSKFDVLAVVTHDGVIRYTPELPWAW